MRTGRHRADLDEAEAQRGKAVDIIAVLVQPGRETHRIRKIEPHHRFRTEGDRPAKWIQRSQPAQRLERRQAETMGSFGVEPKQQGTEQIVKHRIRKLCSGSGRSLAANQVRDGAHGFRIQGIGTLPTAQSATEAQVIGLQSQERRDIGYSQRSCQSA